MAAAGAGYLVLNGEVVIPLLIEGGALLFQTKQGIDNADEVKNSGSESKGSKDNQKTLNSDELKNIGTKGDNSGIRHVQGTMQDAQNLFNQQVNPNTVKEVKSGLFVGEGYDGVTYTFRAVSESGPPTIDINGISGLRKIKFIP